MLTLFAEKQSSEKADSLLTRASYFSALEQFDSSRITLSALDTSALKASRKELSRYLSKLNDGVRLDYAAYRDLTGLVFHTKSLSNKQKVNFMMNMVPVPDSDTIPRDYILIQFSAMNIYSNFLSMEDATRVNDSLKGYVKKFDPTHPSTIRAEVLLLNHDFTLTQINGNNTELMYEIYSEMDSLSKIVGDPFLLALSDYVAMAFYTSVGNLDAFLDAGERCLALARTDDAAKYLIASAIEYTLNGYIYQGQNLTRIQELITELDQMEQARWQTYVVYAQYIEIIPENSPEWNTLYSKFSASNFTEFVENLSQAASNELEGKDLLDYLETLTRSLSKLGEDQLALDYASKANLLVKKLYTEEMSTSIAKVETEYALKSKNAELEKEREIQEVYQTALIIGGLIMAILIALVFYIWKQNSQLSQKNNEIEAQRSKLEKSEKEISLLLKEVHHRVKNNFQVVSSLLELQFRNVSDEETQTLLQEGKNRVQSMAFIHQQLYQNDQLHIHFDEYVPKLVSELARMYGGESIESNIQIEKGLSLDIDTAIPLGLILNELITNAMKYGFSESKKKLTICLDRTQPGEYLLSVNDNGKGMPANFSLESANSMGLRLVKRLSKQLLGSVRHSSEEGCTFYIEFKDTIARNKVD